jgi:hypothetical protein
MLCSACYISNCYDYDIAIKVVILLVNLVVNGIMGVYRGYAIKVSLTDYFQVASWRSIGIRQAFRSSFFTNYDIM